MIFVPFVIAVVVYILTYLPGRVVMERFSNLDREEKFCLSFFITLVSLYLLCFGSFVLTKNPVLSYRIILLGILVFTIARYRIVKALIFDRAERALFLAGLFMLLWLVGFQGLLRLYGGGGWQGDWVEHYERGMFFLGSVPLNYKFIGIYPLPARPPLFNVITAFFHSFLGRPFWIYQILCSFLNMTIIFPAFLLARRLFKNKPPLSLCAIIALFLLNPAMVRQMTYTMTKGLSAAFVLAGAYLYLKARGTSDFKYLMSAFLLLCAGVLAHYSAAPFFLVIGFDFLIMSILKPDRRKILSFVAATLLSAAFLLTWISYSLALYGKETTFLSNTAYKDSRDLAPAQRLKKDLFNLRTTFFPNKFYWEPAGGPDPAMKIFTLYDTLIVFHSESLPGNLTPFFSLALIVSFAIFLKRQIPGKKRTIPPSVKDPFHSQVFWGLFFIGGGLIGLVTNATKMDYGAAHVSFVPVSVLLLSMAYVLVMRIRQAWLKIPILLGVILEGAYVLSVNIAALSDIFVNMYSILKSLNLVVSYSTIKQYDLKLLEMIYSPVSVLLLFAVGIGWIIWAVIFVKHALIKIF